MTFSLIIAVIAFISWIYLSIFRGGFWQADQAIENDSPVPSVWPEVTIVIPARNEVAVINRALLSHLATIYEGHLSIVVVDDHSDDGTADAVQRIAKTAQRDITITSAPILEPGWTGKLWALNHGLDIAQRSYPETTYFLLTDAEIIYEPYVLSDLVAKAEDQSLSLASLMALLDAKGFWAGLLIPAFVFFFQKLYPFPWVNDSRRQTAATAGGCTLVRRDDLMGSGGLAAIRDQLIDDCALARLIKGKLPQRKIWLGLTQDVQSLRDNRKLVNIWNMVARTAFAQLNYSPALLAGTLVGMALLYLAPPLTVLTWPVHQGALTLSLALSAWLLMSGLFIPTLNVYQRSPWVSLALPFAGVMYGLMTLASALRYWRGRGGQWKGRHYQSLR
jgi:hopene-associated glycosyltransferase HpnB